MLTPAPRAVSGREPGRARPVVTHRAGQIRAEHHGDLAGAGFQSPLAICISIGFIPAAWIAISTWPGPACGVGSSVTDGRPRNY